MASESRGGSTDPFRCACRCFGSRCLQHHAICAAASWLVHKGKPAFIHPQLVSKRSRLVPFKPTDCAPQLPDHKYRSLLIMSLFMRCVGASALWARQYRTQLLAVRRAGAKWMRGRQGKPFASKLTPAAGRSRSRCNASSVRNCRSELARDWCRCWHDCANNREQLFLVWALPQYRHIQRPSSPAGGRAGTSRAGD